MDIQITCRRKTAGLEKKRIETLLRLVLKDLDCKGRELSILLTDDLHIAQLNKHYRKKDGPTNVLAFPLQEECSTDPDTGMLGDVVVSIDTAVREANTVGEPLEQTLYRLLIHGVLHLLHYDHERSKEDKDEMQRMEERLLALMKGAPD